jgi:AcrR family transcriptional regulator
MFLEGKRLDMQALAAELRVSRATLYRWTGHREQLLADVLWSLSDDSFERAKADHPEHTGGERLLAIFRQHVGVLVRARPLQTFLQQETHAALRILTSTDGGVQPRTVWKLAQLYREEQQAARFSPARTPPYWPTPSSASPRDSSITTRFSRSNPKSNVLPQSSR